MPAKGEKQRKLMGAVYAAKKGGKPASKKVKEIAKHMTKKAARDFAKKPKKGKK